MDTMDFKVNRQTFVANCTVLDSSCEQAVERDFVLPDYCPDIFRVLKCRCCPRVLSYSLVGRKLSFELAVTLKLIYESEGSDRLTFLGSHQSSIPSQRGRSCL